MTIRDKWIPFSWFCVNCGAIVTGYKNSKGDIKVECKECNTVMVRTLKTPKHNTIDIYVSEERVNV